jgi:GNAT superfamily N-acetyltransferase
VVVVVLRRAQPQEIDHAVDVWSAANADSRLMGHPSQLRTWSQADGALLATAVDEGHVVAMGLAVPGRANDGTGEVIEGWSHLTGMAVLPDYQGQGLGGRLLDYIIAEVKATGSTQATLWTHSTNIRARALFESRGLRASGRMVRDEAGDELIHFEGVLHD